jgi:putative phage-type endonuclease
METTEQDFYHLLEDIEKDEEENDVNNVLYHFKNTLEIARDDDVEWEEVDDIYDRYKRWKHQKFQVNFLKMIRQPEQRSKEWYDMRNNMITASDIAAVIGEDPYGNFKKVFNKKAFLAKDEFTGNFATEWGVKYEPMACAIYEKKSNSRINHFGLLPHYSNFQPQKKYLQPITFLGASPDGIRNDGIMLEIKCPTSREITGIPPRYYWVQMQIQMECCNLDMCHFLECKFIEFSNKDEFYQSIKEHPNSEKGVVSYNETTKEYQYLYPLPKISEIQSWCEERKNVKLSFFELAKYSCVEVKREPEWFLSVLPKIRDFWRDVLDARKNPEKYIKKEKDAINRVVRKVVKKESCKILFDQFEQMEDENKSVNLSDEQLNKLIKTSNEVDSGDDKSSSEECLL